MARSPARTSRGTWRATACAVAVEHTVAPEIGAADILLNRASEFSADLLVVGAYGHSRLREFLLGGVTRSLLREMTVPVLLSH